ncbi:alpha-glucuronidase family glycosyl hydrolase [Marinoscillum furvescens]|uniref:Xylan alpha-1,2-glucuronidase n=1 Tax=Marinoscillum furvescens DSM 4134 TaxID=1122208 RepID=A0A3D9L4U8_MARFU|nr:alpha-glucuronidase family glycosyl hydrolase [Marinoscillum furvescens]REE01043.1 alpha-glucuronidase [Marinoscillum furvescens DSM 4134]
MTFILRSTILNVLILIGALDGYSENGYDLWLRYAPITDSSLKDHYLDYFTSFHCIADDPTAVVIRKELALAASSMLGIIPNETSRSKASLVIATVENLDIPANITNQLGTEGYYISANRGQVTVTANTSIGLLYGTYHLLRLTQMGEPLGSLSIIEAPKTKIRILNHWDNLDRSSERGYAGFSIWDWHRLPGYIDQRYIDYARANASIGINATVLTNVNANAQVLTPMYLEKVKALADVFRPYGIRVYLTARFSAPIEIGGLKTADPLAPEVQTWWQKKAEEIYSMIPDFGGFLVKANSEGQPGPQNYGRNHADGANMLADALRPFGGTVMWRAFVYSDEEPDDRAKQAYNEFKPLDGQFHENVMIQVKNGPIDFQPREPFHPLFGAMPNTPLMMEFQITQEYLGQATQLVYLAPMYEECLQSDTYAKGESSTVASVIDGTLHDYQLTGMAGVANIGTDINWTGHPMAQSNWYAFGRLAWNPQLDAQQIADEWIRATFGNERKVVETISELMLNSWETAVSYMTPLGLHHLMGTSHHYGPAPWVDNLSRADWTPYYYHKSNQGGIGFDRTSTGSNATSQYFPPVASTFNDPDSCPEKFLLWFHHLPWTCKMKSGKTLWEALAYHYQNGVAEVRRMQAQWKQLKPYIDHERHQSVSMLLDIQEQEAIWWKDACMSYFQSKSGLPYPEAMEAPQHDLEYYQSLKFPFAPGIRPKW